MKTFRILLALLTLLSLNSCGTQKAAVNSAGNGPVIQTKFFGARFEDSPWRVYNKINRYCPIKEDDGSFTIIRQDFGGCNWHFVEMSFVEDMFYRINFQQEFKTESAAKSRFDSIYGMLRVKYGEMEVNNEGDGFTYTDAATNVVSIRVHPGTSKSGQEFWYCDLSYCSGAGLLIMFLKSLNEI